MKLLLKASKSSGVKIATHGSIHFARTSPPENEALSLAGSVSRFFASSENSKWPLNATVHIPRDRDPRRGCYSAGVAEWEEPRDSGLFACCSSNPHFPTLQLFSPPIRPVCIDEGGHAPAKVHSHAVFARGTRWETGAQVVLQPEGFRGRTSASVARRGRRAWPPPVRP